MGRKLSAPILFCSLLIIWGCSAAIVKKMPVSLSYIPSDRAEFRAIPETKLIGLGIFKDARPERPSGAVGERIHLNRDIDRYLAKKGAVSAVYNIVHSYFIKRKVRTLKVKWNGHENTMQGIQGDLLISVRILGLWFSARDSVTMSSASSIVRLELKVGAPKNGHVITKTIQIEPTMRRSVFWDLGDVENWLSRSISEALDRILPDLQRRLAG